MLILSKNHILPCLKVDNKKDALQQMANLAEPITGIDQHAIFEVLFAREKLATTGVGHGVAIPHGKANDIDQVYGFFARLETPIDFESIDNQPVDLMFMLLAPHDAGADHLRALAKVSQIFRDKAFTAKLRKTDDLGMLYAMLNLFEKQIEEAA